MSEGAEAGRFDDAGTGAPAAASSRGRGHDAARDAGESREDDRPGNADDDEKLKKASALKKPWVRIALILAAIVIVVALILYFVHYERTGKYLQSTNDAMIEANDVTVAPQVNGYVLKVLVEDNQDVRAGDPLVQIDARDYQAQVAQYYAQAAAQLENADNYRAQIREQQATVAQSRQEYLSSLASARYQASEAARYAPLAASGAETKEKAAQYQSQAVSYAHTAASDRAQMISAQRKIAALQAQVRQAIAQANASKAQAEGANVNVSYTLIRAAVAGRVGDKTVQTGQYVAAGTKMMSLVPLSGLYVTANFKETQLGIMRPRQPATITVDALPGVKLDGHVISASPGTGAQFSLIPPQNATGNFTKIVQRVPVKIAIDAGAEARKVLVPGLSVNVTVNTIGAKGSMELIKDQERQRREQEAKRQKELTRQVRRANP